MQLNKSQVEKGPLEGSSERSKTPVSTLNFHEQQQKKSDFTVEQEKYLG